MKSTIIDAYDEAPKTKSVSELIEYVQEGDGVEMFIQEEVRMMCAHIEAVKDAKTVADICSVLGEDEDWVRYLYDIPNDVTVLPAYVARMLACDIIHGIIESGRTRTCQICGRMFLSETEKFACETCENSIFDDEE